MAKDQAAAGGFAPAGSICETRFVGTDCNIIGGRKSGNERAVKRCKLSSFVKDGMRHQLCDVDLLCDIWEAWTFRVNFMYEDFQ